MVRRRAGVAYLSRSKKKKKEMKRDRMYISQPNKVTTSLTIFDRENGHAGYKQVFFFFSFMRPDTFRRPRLFGRLHRGNKRGTSSELRDTEKEPESLIATPSYDAA